MGAWTKIPGWEDVPGMLEGMGRCGWGKMRCGWRGSHRGRQGTWPTGPEAVVRNLAFILSDT